MRSRIRTLLPGNGPGLTDIDGEAMGAGGRRGPGARPVTPKYRVITNPVPFTTTAGAAIPLVPENRNRVGLFLQNLDASNALYIGWRILADANSMQMVALQMILLDFVCPTDAISAYSTVALKGMLLEWVRVPA